ncbi:MAG TPA: 4-hydroxybenzoate octaprenyltransferase [Xanthomonadaceae bacterium]|nr:4-hydroxybenzoate octaprenyltransferase [Xanthomonadaceae bacterium]
MPDPWRQYAYLMRVDKPIGTLLLLWPTWWALWLAAEGFPPIVPLLIFTLGVVLMRAAGCVINDVADRRLDPQVARTRERPLAAGRVRTWEALLLFLALIALAFGLVLLTNRLTLYLSVAGAFLAATYPFIKRVSHLAQAWLGAAFGWAVPMAFAAVTGTVPQLAWLVFCAVVLWAVAYDTLYAMVDRKDDIRAGAKSTAILFGDLDLTAIGILHGSFLLAMLFVGQQAGLGWPYWSGLAVALALAAWQLWWARKRSPERCFQAFLNNQWIGLALWLGMAIAFLIKPVN